MSSKLNYLMPRAAATAAVIIFWSLINGGAAADVVEVAPGIRITKKSFNVPMNEQPFFGFIEKTPELRTNDAKFVSTVVSAAGGQERAFDETLRRAWAAFSGGRYEEASRRFNQACLIDCTQSSVYHGFAVLVAARFGDMEYAEELFRIAMAAPYRRGALSADYGRLLLVMKRPRDAQVMLEQAVVETPDFGTAWSNLAWARYYNGDAPGACLAAGEALRKSIGTDVQSDLRGLRGQARCD